MKNSLRKYIHLLSTYLRPYWSHSLQLAVLLLVYIGLQLVNPLLLSNFIDSALSGASLETLFRLALLFIGVAFTTQIVSVAEVYVAENLSWKATNRLRTNVARHCLHLDLSFHNEHTPGELIERIDGDVAALGNFFSRFVIYLLGNVLLLIGALFLLIRIDWHLGLLLLAVCIVGLMLLISVRNVSVPYWVASQQARADLFGFLEEHLSGTEDLRANGAVPYTMQKLYMHGRNVLLKERKAGVLSVATANTSRLFFTIGTALAFIFIVFLFNGNTITLGTAYLIYRYTEMLVRPTEEVNRQMQDFQQATASISRVQDLLDLCSNIQDGKGGVLPVSRPLSIEFDHVSFTYKPEEPVLQDISFFVQPGTTLGVLGRTGSGKTTMTRLLFRLYDPTSGIIRLGGVDLRQLPLAELHQHIGIVTQDVQLFHATVRDNLTFFDPTVPDSHIIQALQEVGLSDWYTTLQDGLETKLASGGSGLSAGEAQLLAFARIFLKKPAIIILDEASSRLDPVTEQHIESAIDRLLKQRTALIIAHHLTTVQRADAILILDNGHIHEHGSREELVNTPSSHFAQLLHAGLEDIYE